MVFKPELESLPIRERLDKKLDLLRVEWKRNPAKRWLIEKQARFLEIAILKHDEHH